MKHRRLRSSVHSSDVQELLHEISIRRIVILLKESVRKTSSNVIDWLASWRNWLLLVLHKNALEELQVEVQLLSFFHFSISPIPSWTKIYSTTVPRRHIGSLERISSSRYNLIIVYVLARRSSILYSPRWWENCHFVVGERSIGIVIAATRVSIGLGCMFGL